MHYNYNYADVRFPAYIQNQLNQAPPAAPGRHKAILDISLQMVGEGIPDDVIFSAIRNWIPDDDKKDPEIREAIKGAYARNPKPACGTGQYQSYDNGKQKPLPTDKLTSEPFQVLSGIFAQDESVCITFPNRDGNPTIDKVQTLSQWTDDYRAKPETFSTTDGIWFMINPVKPGATSHTTESVSDFRYSLVELEIPKPLRERMSPEDIASEMKRFYSAIRESNLPIAATYTSGGPSLHALVKIGARTLEEYKQRVKVLYEYCAAIPGFDKQNSNASRLSRLPGAFRNGKLQRPISGEMGASTWEEWIAALPCHDNLPVIRTFRQLQETPMEWPDELVEGILHRGSKMTISSSSKSKKTWIMLHLALSLASGEPWLGNNTSKCKVLFVNLELQECFLKYRLNKIYPEMLIEEDSFAENLHTLTLRGYCADAATLIPILINRTKGKDYGAIFLDPTYKLMGGRDENAAGEIGELLNEFEKLSVHTGASVISSAHYSKGNQAGKESIDRTSGSGVFGRDPDTIMTLTQHEEQNAVVAEFNLRNFPPKDSFTVEWENWLFRRSDLDPSRLKKRVGRPSHHSVNDLLTILGEQDLLSTEWAAQCKEAGICGSVFYTLFAELRKSGRIHQCAMDKKWEIVRIETN